MTEKVFAQIELETLKEIREQLRQALEPMTPYKRDPLEFSEAAHDEKNKIIERVLKLLPLPIA